MRVVVHGGGVAGLALAWALHRGGAEVVVLQEGDCEDTDPSIVELYGAGYDAAEALGLVSRLEAIHNPSEQLVCVDRQGRVRAAVRHEAVRRGLFRDRYFKLLRSDLVRVLRDRLRGRCELRSHCRIAAIEDDGRRVRLTLDDGIEERADALVGAGAGSAAVRRLLWGEPSDRQCCDHRALTLLTHPTPPSALDRATVVVMTAPGLHVAIHPLRDDRVVIQCLSKAVRGAEARARQDVSGICGEFGGIVADLRQHVEVVGECRHERMITRWSRGRVVVVPEPSHGPSPFAGAGPGLAAAAAVVLADEMGRVRFDVERALRAYERRVKPRLLWHERVTRRALRWSLPSTNVGVAWHRAVTRGSAWPPAALFLRQWMDIEWTGFGQSTS